MCKAWRDSYSTFRKWAFENGYNQNAPRGACVIDRIDNSKGYKPSNCRWVSSSKQNTQKIDTIIYSYYGKKMNAREWSKYLGIEYQKLLTMLHKGVTIGDIVRQNKAKTLNGI